MGVTTFEDKSPKRILVYCEKKKEGCKWEGELGNELEKHLNESPPPERQLEGCEFIVVKCLYCPHNCRRASISAHQKNCRQRPHECEYCGYKDTYEKVTQNHQKIILCPAFRHSSLVAQFTSDTKNELSSLQQKNEQLKGDLKEVDKTNKQLKDDLEEVDKAAKAKIASLESRLRGFEDELKCAIKSLKDKNEELKKSFNYLLIGLAVVIVLLLPVLLAPSIKRDKEITERVERLERTLKYASCEIL